MNKQKKDAGIEWTHVPGYGGYTSNPIQGCTHKCEWIMPDKTHAICYAKRIAESVAKSAYPDGFESLQFNPDELDAIRRAKKPAAIFIDSMSDLVGEGVPTEWIEAVIETMRDCPQHIFQILTKNAPRLLQFEWPSNAWVGISSPPDFMFGKQLYPDQQTRMLRKSLDVLGKLNSDVDVRWMSFEPLSWDVSQMVASRGDNLDWAVIGAASDDAGKYHAPNAVHVEDLLMALDSKNTPVFFKGNMRSLTDNYEIDWRDEFPKAVAT